MRAHLLALAAVSGLVGCNGCLGNPSPVGARGSQLPNACSATQPLTEPQKLDILFVIDNSSSMGDDQQNVAQGLVAFIDEIKKGGGVETDFHVGVINTSVYLSFESQAGQKFPLRLFPDSNGKLQPVPDTATFVGDKVVRTFGPDPERMLVGSDPELVAKLQRLVMQGTDGSGQETPYEAVRLALFDQNATPLSEGGNGGFFRDGARLLVVVLSDEDDCSEDVRPPTVFVSDRTDVDDCLEQTNQLTPVSEYFRLFTQEARDNAGRRRDIVWAEIAPVSTIDKKAMVFQAGPGAQVQNIDCSTSNAPGFRHVQMAQLFDPTLKNLDSICSTDLNGNPSFTEMLKGFADLVNVSQTLAVTGVPDPRLLQVSLTRFDGKVQLCTVGNGGISYSAPTQADAAQLHFSGVCQRFADDKAVSVNLLCAN
ncbi:MAG: VWA domain-containing protein [Myxococcaceae bacterium]